MKKLKQSPLLCALSVFCLIWSSSEAKKESVESTKKIANPVANQSQQKEFHIKLERGRTLDVLTVSPLPKKDSLVNEYFKNVYPVAQKYGYEPKVTFSRLGQPTLGTYQPDYLVLTSWANEQSRTHFRSEASEMSYDYKAARRNLWSVFNLTEYESLSEDMELSINTNKLYVMTAFWAKDMESLETIRSGPLKSMTNTDGVSKLLLKKGKSPVGYLYEPDLLSITEWDSEKAFDDYFAANPLNLDNGIKNVNQWKMTFLPPRN